MTGLTSIRVLWHDPGGTTFPTRVLVFQTMPKRRKEQGQTAANADRVVNVRTGFRTRLDLIQQTNIPSCVVVKSDESTLAETFQISLRRKFSNPLRCLYGTSPRGKF